MAVSTVKRNGGILAIPAGIETTLRASGTIRAHKTIASPYFTNQRSARSSRSSSTRSQEP